MAKGISDQSLRHINLRKQVIRAFPQTRNLAGANPWTALALPLLLCMHWGVAWLASASNIIVCFVLSLLIGQVLIHSAGALLHETAHRLIFHNGRAKLIFDLGLEVLLASFGKQLSYQYEHITSHHAHLGDYDHDYEHEDICHLAARKSLREQMPYGQKFLTYFTLAIHALPLGFLVAGFAMPKIIQYFSGKNIKDKARVIGARNVPVPLRLLFVLVSIISNLFLFWAFGFLGWLYHVWSLSLFLGKMGVTNLGQSLSEHNGDNPDNPTYSDYRLTNLFFFNTGYHNEHHTFPNVSWNKLPDLRKAAPQFFNLENPRSYFTLWWQHISADFSATRQSRIGDREIETRCQNAET